MTCRSTWPVTAVLALLAHQTAPPSASYAHAPAAALPPAVLPVQAPATPPAAPSPSGGHRSRAGGVGPGSAGAQPVPATPEAARSPRQTPAPAKGAERNDYEQHAMDDLRNWQGRLEEFRRQAAESNKPRRRGQAAHLSRLLTTAKLRLDALRRQPDGPNWETQRQKYEQAMDRFHDQWHSATGH